MTTLPDAVRAYEQELLQKADMLAMGLGRQPARMHHAMQAHHQGLALDLELGLVEIVDDVLDR